MSADADDRFSLLDSLAEEFAERFRRGERPSIHEYAERHPELADDLREILGAMAQIEQAEVDVRGPGPLAATELLRPLDQVGDYRILREIGRGGMGIVYEAEQMSLKRRVALKVLLGRTGRNAAALERFRREARSAARLHHSNIVPVFEVGQHGDVLFYAMQMIAGQSLDQVLQEVRRLRSSVAASPHSTGQAAALLISGSFGRDGPPDATAPGTQPTAGIRSASSQRPSSGTNRSPYYRSIAQIGRQVAVALAYAHQRGVVHRDIKPSNLLLDLAGVVWITDFGLAKTDDEGLTQSGDVVGTLRYLAPERFQGQCDVRADIYALGLTLYEMLVMQPALEAPDRLRLIEMIRSQDPVPPRQIDARLPRDLETIVLKASHKNPDSRYQSADDLAEDLRRFLADETIKARRTSVVEQLGRWLRRNRWLAASLMIIFCLLMCGLAVTVNLNLQLGTARDAALRAAADADKAREHEARLRHAAELHLYTSRIALAQHAWTQSNVQSALQLLELCRPAADGPDLRGWEWYYLHRLCHLESLSLPSHDGPVFCVAYSPNGKWLASAGGGNLYFSNPGAAIRPGQVVIHDAVSGAALHRLTTFSHLVTRLAFSQDSTRLAAVTLAGEVRIFDTVSGKEAAPSIKHEGGVVSVGFDPSGAILLTGAGGRMHGSLNGGDGAVRIWNLADGRELFHITTDKDETTHAAFSPDGQTIAAAWGRDGSYHVGFYDASGKPRCKSEGVTARIFQIAFSPDGRLLATANEDGWMRLYDTATGKLVRVLTGTKSPMRSIAFHPLGKRLASAGDTPEVRIWDVDSGEFVQVLRGPTDIIETISFSPDGTRLATGDHTGVVKTWEAAGDQRGVLLDHKGYSARAALTFVRGSARLLVALEKTSCVDWLDLHTGKSGQTSIPPLRLGEPAALSACGTRLAFPAEPDGDSVTVWEPNTGKRLLDLAAGPGPVSALAFSADGKNLASSHIVLSGGAARPGGDQAGKYSFVVIVANAQDGTRLQVLDAANVREFGKRPRIENGASLAVSADGRWLASSGNGGKVYLWNLQTASIQYELGDDPDWHRSLTFSGDGKLLAAQAHNKHISVWNVADGTVRCRINHVVRECGLCLSPDGRRLAASDMWGTIRLWETDIGVQVCELRGLAGSFGTVGVRAQVAFDHNGRRLASFNNNDTTNVYDAGPDVLKE